MSRRAETALAVAALLTVSCTPSAAGATWSFAPADTLTVNTNIAITGTTTVDVASGTVVFAGTVSGSGGLTKRGSGSLYLANRANTYDGPMTVSSGALHCRSFAAVTLNGGTLRLYGAGMFETGQPIRQNGNTQLYVTDSTDTLVVNGPWTGRCTVRGSGTCRLARYVAAGEAPMDFYAWHVYALDSVDLTNKFNAHLAHLRRFGLEGKIPIVNTEWCPVVLRYDAQGRWDFSQMETMKSAVSGLACMCVMQHTGHVAADYYDADPRSRFCGLYDYDGTRYPHFYMMKAFSLLREGKTETVVSGETDKVRALAAKSGRVATFAVTAEDEPATVELRLKNLPAGTIERRWLAEGSLLEKDKEFRWDGVRALRLKMPANSAAVFRWTKA